ncbi:hypothetical protein HUW51_13795 [Adhaeribacter swui]|uniref:Uncharacterized protein n=1 Tax=Adhaeribacter swui TaxID=2086471 RepID=A0A7G7G9A6_9BACT|nr:hypothetical protein [Adhaeribacter swui]QNF33740.1 hypothetical protein HUW51_13795 [Adhaeribacter swui]
MVRSKFIKDILTLLLDGDEEGVFARNQLNYITEKEVEYTGAGVFIYFKYANGIEKFQLENRTLILDGVKIISTELTADADATLFYKNGLIDYLEVWSHNGEYPKTELKNYVLKQDWKSSPNRIITHN